MMGAQFLVGVGKEGHVADVTALLTGGSWRRGPSSTPSMFNASMQTAL
jgi:hypothetical protein